MTASPAEVTKCPSTVVTSGPPYPVDASFTYPAAAGFAVSATFSSLLDVTPARSADPPPLMITDMGCAAPSTADDVEQVPAPGAVGGAGDQVEPDTGLYVCGIGGDPV